MTLFMRDEEKRAEGRAEGLAEGRAEERAELIQRMIRKGYSKDALLEIGYTEEEYEQAEKALFAVK